MQVDRAKAFFFLSFVLLDRDLVIWKKVAGEWKVYREMINYYDQV